MCEEPNWICRAVISVWHRGVTVRSLPALSREGKRSRPQPTWKRFQNAFVKKALCRVRASVGPLSGARASRGSLLARGGASCFSISATMYSRVPACSAEMWRPRARCFFGKATRKGASLAECLHSRIFPAARLVGVILPQGFLELGPSGAAIRDLLRQLLGQPLGLHVAEPQTCGSASQSARIVRAGCCGRREA